MSIFILANKNLKGSWRNLMIALYTADIVWLFVTWFLRQNKMVNEEGFSFLVMGFIIIAVIITISEIIFHWLVRREIKS